MEDRRIFKYGELIIKEFQQGRHWFDTEKILSHFPDYSPKELDSMRKSLSRYLRCQFFRKGRTRKGYDLVVVSIAPDRTGLIGIHPELWEMRRDFITLGPLWLSRLMRANILTIKADLKSETVSTTQNRLRYALYKEFVSEVKKRASKNKPFEMVDIMQQQLDYMCELAGRPDVARGELKVVKETIKPDTRNTKTRKGYKVKG